VVLLVVVLPLDGDVPGAPTSIHCLRRAGGSVELLSSSSPARIPGIDGGSGDCLNPGRSWGDSAQRRRRPLVRPCGAGDRRFSARSGDTPDPRRYEE
jgi:hypothetical protein